METIPWYRSNTIRALIVAMVAQILAVIGVTDDIANQQAAGFADAAINIIEMLGLMWAGYARLHQPTPPLTATAAKKTKEMQNDTPPTHI